MGDNRDKFLFISGLSKLNEGDADGCLARLDTLVKAYPQSKVSELAGMIINGVRQGRTLMGGNFNMSDVWNRRTAVMSDKDTTNAKGFSDERNTEFTFMFVYNPDSISENKLLFQLAKFNFSNFVVRNFNIEIVEAAGLHHMTVTGFRSFDEARQYARVLYKNDGMMNAAKGSRSVVISNENLPMLGTQYSYNEYDAFYTEHFQPLKVDNPYMLYEPDYDEKAIEKDINRRNVNVAPALPSETVAPNGAAPVSGSEEREGEDDNNNSFGLDMPQNDVLIQQTEDTIAVPTEDTQTQPQTEDIITVPTVEADSPVKTQTEDTEVILDFPTIPATEQPQTEESFILEEKTPEVNNTPTEDIIIVEDTKKPEEPQQEENIILDDSIKEDSKLLEDEYYELDGF